MSLDQFFAIGNIIAFLGVVLAIVVQVKLSSHSQGKLEGTMTAELKNLKESHYLYNENNDNAHKRILDAVDNTRTMIDEANKHLIELNGSVRENKNNIHENKEEINKLRDK